MSCGRTLAVAVEADGEIWLLGGQEGQHLANLCCSSDEVWIYSPQSGWRDGPQLDFPFSWTMPTSAAVFEGQLVLLGESWPLRPVGNTYIVDRHGAPDKKILALPLGAGCDQLCKLIPENFKITDAPGDKSLASALVTFRA